MTIKAPSIDVAGRRLRYSPVAITLHWTIAALILYNLVSGLLRPVLPPGFFRFHISSGITILVLSVVRVAWRLTHRPPPLLPMTRNERGVAHGVHGLLYAAMLLLPLSGWALVSAKPPVGSAGEAWSAAHPPAGAHEAGPGHAARGPTMVWSLWTLPLIGPVHDLGRDADHVPQQRQLRRRIGTMHLLGAWAMVALLVLHIAGALKHQLIDRQPELERMGLG